jgi:DNA-binding CsgD family transcriptional regulator
MSPLVKLEAVGHGIDAAFARALPTLKTFDPARLAESMARCTPFAEIVNVVDVTPESPLGWRYPAVIGLHHMRGVSSASSACLGSLPDQGFAREILLPTYLDVIEAAQPVMHKIVTIANDVFVSYRKLSCPIYAASQTGRSVGSPSHILMLMYVDFAIPQIRSGQARSLLSLRERQCLSLTAAGLGAKQMANEIGISEKTIELHLSRARQKLGARTTAQAVAINLAMAMVSP